MSASTASLATKVRILTDFTATTSHRDWPDQGDHHMDNKDNVIRVYFREPQPVFTDMMPGLILRDRTETERDARLDRLIE